MGRLLPEKEPVRADRGLFTSPLKSQFVRLDQLTLAALSAPSCTPRCEASVRFSTADAVQCRCTQTRQMPATRLFLTRRTPAQL